MAALSAVHAGKLSLDQKVTIDAKYQGNDSGAFQHLTLGFWSAFRDALVTIHCERQHVHGLAWLHGRRHHLQGRASSLHLTSAMRGS
jgi:hypothetical protein